MIYVLALVKGMLFGFSVAAPVGPIGLLCIQRTLIYGRRHGFVSGLGTATADMLCGALVCFGVTGILLMDSRLGMGMRLAGGAYLLYLGIRIIRSEAVQSRALIQADSLRRTYLSLFLLTLANPLTWLTFAGGYAGLGLEAETSGYGVAVCFIMGVFGGSACWWWLLSAFTARLSRRLNGRSLEWINRVSGSLISAFGIWALWSGIS